MREATDKKHERRQWVSSWSSPRARFAETFWKRPSVSPTPAHDPEHAPLAIWISTYRTLLSKSNSSCPRANSPGAASASCPASNADYRWKQELLNHTTSHIFKINVATVRSRQQTVLRDLILNSITAWPRPPRGSIMNSLLHCCLMFRWLPCASCNAVTMVSVLRRAGCFSRSLYSCASHRGIYTLRCAGVCRQQKLSRAHSSVQRIASFYPGRNGTRKTFANYYAD